jgi:hypothetical protein
LELSRGTLLRFLQQEVLNMQYLAVVRCSSDDIPIGLYPTLAEAVGALYTCPADRFNAVASLLSIDPSRFIVGAIYVFDGDTMHAVQDDNDVLVSRAVQAACEQV